MSLLSGRRPFWATTCLVAGYGEETGSDGGLLTAQLAYDERGALREYCAGFGNLGWDSNVLVQSAWVMVQALPLSLISTATASIPALEACIAEHDGDWEAVLHCYRDSTG
jgi:hypothetical protein